MKTKTNWNILMEKQDENTYFIMATKNSENKGEELTAQDLIDEIENERLRHEEL